ncbi:tetratricopeptide repeat protein [Desulfoluna butyratoxydans]|uniref:Tetratricopeptide repeat n=1 Tax=Desulfoluna butyratoxydans TaxID=231438 RepID=A0A4U8YJL8_9BACT|nr:tetratricopeptide repeat protein [Desulfoluna butyratoxydans]VFQ43524.1 tetratricopeptide repeat [Desulfoluna butyratoxydans]
MTAFPKRQGRWIPWAAAALVLMAWGQAMAVEVTRVKVFRAPDRVELTFSEPVAAKVVKIDDHELLIALKDATVSEGLLPGPGTIEVAVRRRTPSVTTLLVRTADPILAMEHGWTGSRLVILLSLKETLRSKAPRSVKRPADVLTPERVLGRIPAPAGSRAEETHLVAREGFSGTVDDLLLEVKSTLCREGDGMDRILTLMQSGAYRRAEQEAAKSLKLSDMPRGCAEGLEILRVLSGFRSAESSHHQDGFVSLPARINDFISRYPDSPYLPYALSMLGSTYAALGDHGMAEGYFRVVLEDHIGFTGAPDTAFRLAKLLRRTDRAVEALPMLKTVTDLGESLAFAGEAKKEMALVLYDVGDFAKSQALFEALMAESEEAVWQDPDLLLYGGQAALRAGHREVARRYLVQFANLFPDAQGADMALESVGESWLDDGRPDRAKAFFRMVIERYTEGEGYVTALVRLAEQLPDRKEKEALYTQVIDDFSEHPLARLSMLRMASLYDEAGEHEASVAMVKKLLEVGAGGLRAEAYARAEQAVLGHFKGLMAEGRYVDLIAFFEKERRLLHKLENPDIFLLAGEAFMTAHLYGSAAKELERAIVLSMKRLKWSGEERLAGLYFQLGQALDEGGRKKEAQTIFTRYLERYPKAPGQGESSLRLGRILYEAGELEQAEVLFKKSLSFGEGAEAQVWLSRCREDLGDHAGAAGRLKKAIPLLEAGEPVPSDDLYAAYRRLGDLEMKLGKYLDAVTAFAGAEKYAGEEVSGEELRFLRADALAKGGETSRAMVLYRAVSTSDDEFWSGMATERLRAMELDKRLGGDR